MKFEDYQVMKQIEEILTASKVKFDEIVFENFKPTEYDKNNYPDKKAYLEIAVRFHRGVGLNT